MKKTIYMMTSEELTEYSNKLNDQVSNLQVYLIDNCEKLSYGQVKEVSTKISNLKNIIRSVEFQLSIM
jgi:hypothetical protein